MKPTAGTWRGLIEHIDNRHTSSLTHTRSRFYGSSWNCKHQIRHTQKADTRRHHVVTHTPRRQHISMIDSTSCPSLSMRSSTFDVNSRRMGMDRLFPLGVGGSRCKNPRAKLRSPGQLGPGGRILTDESTKNFEGCHQIRFGQ